DSENESCCLSFILTIFTRIFAKMYTLKKDLGQHFLHDENCVKKIINSIQKEGLQQLLEIGPGGAALTKHLLTWDAVNFKAVEVDVEKVNFLLRTFPALEGKLVHADILKIAPPFEGHFSIVGNLPYNISSPILFRILEWRTQVDELVAMFQKEVAARVVAKEGSKAYGILSVLIQLFFEVEYLMDVPPESFTPPPKVMSGVIRMKSKGNPYGIEDFKKFKTLV